MTKKLSPNQTENIIHFINVLKKLQDEGQMKLIPPLATHIILALHANVPKKYRQSLKGFNVKLKNNQI